MLRNKRFELDIYIPSLRKAIEYDGEYWHGRPEAIGRDSKKDIQCREAGIELLRIPEEQYLKDKSGTMELIKKWLAEPHPQNF
jgi:very-short-patch-repair endonuclease